MAIKLTIMVLFLVIVTLNLPTVTLYPTITTLILIIVA